MKFIYKVIIKDIVFVFEDDGPLGSSASTFADIAAAHIDPKQEVIIKVEAVCE